MRRVRTVTVAEGKLVVAERPQPQPAAGEVLVRVHGAGLNRADLAQRAGFYPAPPGSPADIPGLEFAGVIEASGAGVDGVAPGDRVFGITGGGAQAEYLTVPAGQCAPVPDGLELLAMGGVPEAFVTAHDALVTQASLRAGEWLLVTAAGSGVGTAAVQLAKAAGALVAGTARSAGKLARAAELGLDAAIEPRTGADGGLDTAALVSELVAATHGGPNVVLDLAGGAYLESAILAAAPRARIVSVGVVAGGQANLSVFALMSKRLHLIGTVLRARDAAEKAAATRAFTRDVVPLLATGRVVPVIDATIPLADAERGYDLLASNTTFGKVVLDCR